ncbi:MAG: hypothetical protein U5L04_04320 [Trueperaceae bacterium]|nr:hypothetical protein [Trueperaceae bacterium]
MTCFAKRKLGDRETMQAMRGRLSAEEELIWAHIGLAINPDSLYYERRRAGSYDDLGELRKALEHYRAIAQKFPAADLDVYRDWRDAALRVGDAEEALEAVYASREYYGDSTLLAGF